MQELFLQATEGGYKKRGAVRKLEANLGILLRILSHNRKSRVCKHNRAWKASYTDKHVFTQIFKTGNPFQGYLGEINISRREFQYGGGSVRS